MLPVAGELHGPVICWRNLLKQRRASVGRSDGHTEFASQCSCFLTRKTALGGGLRTGRPCCVPC